MKKKSFALATSVALVSSAFLAACSTTDSNDTSSGDKNSDKKSSEQTLNLIESADIPTLNPTTSTDAVSFNVLNNTMEGLYRLDDKQQPTPGIAESHTVSDDKLTYTFKLRDAKWSDGTPITAKDFEYAWKEVLNPENASQYAYVFYNIEGAEEYNTKKGERDAVGVKAVDDKTFEVKLKAPADYFLGLTGFGPFMPKSEELSKKIGKDFGSTADKSLYNGPFKLTEWTREQGWKMVKNDNYWDKDNVKLKTINVKVVKETSTAVNLYEKGDIDRAGLSSEFVAQYQDNKEFKTKGESTIFYLYLNTKVKALNNEKIRRAIDMGYNKKGITDVILANGSLPANYLVPKDFAKDESGKDFREKYPTFNEYNADEAKKLWEEGLKEIGQKSVELELLNYDSDDAKKIGEFLKGELEKNLPGMKVTIKQQPFKNKLDLENKGDFEFSFAGWGPDYQDPMTFLDLFLTDGPYNRGKWSDKEYDKLINDAKTQTDATKRWSELQEAEKILLDSAAISPVYQRGRAFMVKPYVKGIVEHNFGADFSYKWASIEGK
ncbi:peptide ABC transporter substrate-binding protein [Exiguobacterium sp. 17-1]|uniref:peptide ABC transporter substrate-binding protein n=1 Tax=Exiguobacterium TaxID=33986 RepID=UPI001FFEFB84|nr:peptide ABC transporter substrate-binding protein [Exiguobacterium sp. 17-1]MCK2156721.1 peptide ABC transporter substrate-binding protein [Exiguobacterium sp. 17-1]